MKNYLFSLLSLSIFIVFSCHAEIIRLKNGKTIKANIIEKTDKYIRIDFYGSKLTYYTEDIESIDKNDSENKQGKRGLSQTETIDIKSNTIDIERIHSMLKNMGYSQQNQSDIEKQLILFLNKIDFSQLKKKVDAGKHASLQLKRASSEISKLIRQQGYLNIQSPPPLINLLSSTIDKDNILSVIEENKISTQDKKRFEYTMISCGLSQLGSIVLNLLGVKVRIAYSPGHVFNCIPLDENRIFFADFATQVFETINISQYYKLEGKYWVLKERNRISPKQIQIIRQRWDTENQVRGQKELLNLVYPRIYISNGYSAIPAIYFSIGNAYYFYKNDRRRAVANYNLALKIDPDLADVYINRGIIYNNEGNFEQAIIDFGIALSIDPDLTEAYYNRGLAYYRKGDIKQAIADFTHVIKINPDCSIAYVGRGSAYSHEGNFEQAIIDFGIALSIDPDLTEAYYNRGLAYCRKGDPEHGIADYTYALQLNPSYVQIYYNRALAYFQKGDYTSAWEDVHKVQKAKLKIPPEFMQMLRNASGRDN